MSRYRFGSFVVDGDTIEVVGPDGVRAVEPQVFSVLWYLVEQRGRLITKEELLDNVWGDRFVSESALTTRIKQARRALDDDGTTQWAIKTVHGRGYRFLPEVEVVQEPTALSTDRNPADLPVAELPEKLRVDTRQLFCGRLAELEAADRVIATSAADEAFGWIWMLGEPGIGKTRLAAEIARRAHERGHRVLFGRNGEDLRVPYEPFIEVLRQSTESDGPDAIESRHPGLAPLLPEASGSASSVVSERRVDSLVDSETRRYRMFEAVADWLVELSSRSPVTMIVDDVHWAADSTLQLLAHLQRRRHGGAVTFVLTTRDTAPDVNAGVADLIAAGVGGTSTAILRLVGLSSEEAIKLVGREIDLEEIMRQTAGNPLFLQAMSRNEGALDLKSAVRRRLATLDERVQETLRIVSVIGLEFELRVAAAATDRDELDLLDHLETAVEGRLVDDVGNDRFRFTHALIRSSLRSEISSSRRGRMHRRVALAIEEVFGDDSRHLPELAFHTAQAAHVDSRLRPVAIERLRRAAQESSAQFSFGEAAELVQRARTLADASDFRLVAALALEQGIAESRAGKNMTAARTFETAIATARKTGDAVLRVEAALRYEDAVWRPGHTGALALVREATQVLDDAIVRGETIAGETELRARLAVATMRALAMSGDRVEVHDVFQQARRRASELGSANAEAAVLSVYLGQVMFYEGVSEAGDMVERLAELEPFIDDGDVALHAIHDRIMYATLTGRFAERRRLVRTMAELQEQSHSNFWGFIRANQEAMEAIYRGDLATAEALAEHCLELADELPEEDGGGTYGLRMFVIRREQDRLVTMEPAIRHVLSHSGGDGIWAPGLALLLVETGAFDEAADVLDPVRANGFDLPIDAMWSTLMVFLIDAMVHLGDVEACTMLRSRFQGQAGTNVTTGSGLLCFGRAERYLGMLSLVIGDFDTAEEQLRIALEADEAGGSVLWRNESRLWLSRVRRAKGHVAEADALLDVIAAEASSAKLARLVRLAGADRS